MSGSSSDVAQLDRYHPEIARLAEGALPYPVDRFQGAGVVTCAGGRRYYTCAWVLVNLLRHLGCELPIEVWYRGAFEMSSSMQSLLESVPGVSCINAIGVRKRRPVRRLGGWELKPYAILNSRFQEVIFIDCDNAPTRDPSFLLRTPPYRELGAIFWPDRWMQPGDAHATLTEESWLAFDVPKRDEPEHETGQMVIDKRRCWKPLQLAMFYNEHSDFFYRFNLGDKDTFHMAWRRVGAGYAMPEHRPVQDPRFLVLYQHDFEGRVVFQHRNQDKWNYDGGNKTVPGFRHEDVCVGYLKALRRKWDGVVRRFPSGYSAREREAHAQITETRFFRYIRVGHDARLLELRPDFTIGVGSGGLETGWEVEEGAGGRVSLIIRGDSRRACILDAAGSGFWTGHWLHVERMPIVLEPTVGAVEPEPRVAEQLRQLLPYVSRREPEAVQEVKRLRRYSYSRRGESQRILELLEDHSIGRGAGPGQRWWFVEAEANGPALIICGDLGPVCRLSRGPNGVWRGPEQGRGATEVTLRPKPSV